MAEIGTAQVIAHDPMQVAQTTVRYVNYYDPDDKPRVDADYLLPAKLNEVAQANPQVFTAIMRSVGDTIMRWEAGDAIDV